jgi:hypothetical protein
MLSLLTAKSSGADAFFSLLTDQDRPKTKPAQNHAWPGFENEPLKIPLRKSTDGSNNEDDDSGRDNAKPIFNSMA